VADNASTDDSVAYVERHFPSVQILRMDKNRGFAGGYNYALDRIDADYFVLLNQDVAVEPDWIEPLVAAGEAHPELGAAQPKLLDEARRTHFEYAGAAGGMMDLLGYPFCRGRIMDHLEEDRGQYDHETEIFWASGAALFIRAQLYRDLEGLDEAFFAHMEEIDLCWRVKRAGYRILYIPGSTVYHVGGGSLERENPKKLFLNFRNNGRMLIKNCPPGRLLWLMPLRFGLDVLAAFRELVEGRREMASAAWRGSTDTWRHLGTWWRKAKDTRDHIEAHRYGPDRSHAPGWFHGSIVWQFFVRGKKTWRAVMGVE
jgi:GT2 family glycosyltransferase